MSKQSRRAFLQQAVGAAAACAVLPKIARADVNSQIRMAVVGFNGRGMSRIDHDLWCGPAATVDLYRPERDSQGAFFKFESFLLSFVSS